MTRLTDDRLEHLRQAAEIGMRMASLQPHTVHVRPEDLAELVDELLAVRAIMNASFPCGFDKPHVAAGADDDDCDGCNNDGHGVHWAGNCLGTRDEALGIAATIVRCALAIPEEQT